MTKLTLQAVNEMDRETFVRELGGIFEHSPWVAERSWEARPFRSVAELHDAMMGAVLASPEAAILELLRAHPDLGTRMKVTDYSASEQSGAGLDRLTPEEYEEMTSLNERYVGKFGFPFILAVRGKNKDDILASMKERIHHDVPAERQAALEQIRRITGFRLNDLVSD
jgi:2-oxo-4-hydroxy-4-carboxy-5-ureidoimidazoline decarboxylase